MLQKSWGKFPSCCPFSGDVILIYTPISFGVWGKRKQNRNRCSIVDFLNQDNFKILALMRQQGDLKRQQYLLCLSDFIYLFKKISAWSKIEFRLQTILQLFTRLIHQLDSSFSYSYLPVAKCDSATFCVRYELVFNEMDEMTQRQMFLFQFT